MSTGTVELRPAMTPGRVGQATAVEQSRAVAEVQAAVIVAQQCPRSTATAVQSMEEACRQKQLAERAFFRYPRGKDANGKDVIVTGASVHLARELARCWGNVQHGITELARDDAHGQSEMQAWAWDVQTNTRSSNTFIVQHKRDTKWGAKDLTEQRDIYENNANNGARRLREAIFSVLPTWYTESAKALCMETIEKGGGDPLPVRIALLVRAMEKLRIGPARIAAKFGYATVDELTATDLAQLAVIYDSLKQGTVNVDDEFPAEKAGIEADKLAPAAAAKPAAKASTDASPASAAPSAASAPPPPAQGAGEALPPSRPVKLASDGQVGMIRRRFAELGYTDSDDDQVSRLAATAKLAEHDGDLLSTNDLTANEAAKVRLKLDKVHTAQELVDMLQAEVPDGE